MRIGVDAPRLEQHPTAESPSPHRMGRGIKGEVSPDSHHAGTAQQAHHRLQLVISETRELAGGRNYDASSNLLEGVALNI